MTSGALRLRHFNRVLGDITHLGSSDRPTSLRQEFSHGIQIGTVTKKPSPKVTLGHIVRLQRFNILRASFDGHGLEILRGSWRWLRLDDAYVIEHHATLPIGQVGRP